MTDQAAADAVLEVLRSCAHNEPASSPCVRCLQVAIIRLAMIAPPSPVRRLPALEGASALSVVAALDYEISLATGMWPDEEAKP